MKQPLQSQGKSQGKELEPFSCPSIGCFQELLEAMLAMSTLQQHVQQIL